MSFEKCNKVFIEQLWKLATFIFENHLKIYYVNAIHLINKRFDKSVTQMLVSSPMVKFGLLYLVSITLTAIVSAKSVLPSLNHYGIIRTEKYIIDIS